MQKRHIRRNGTGTNKLLPKEGEQRRMCRNNAGTCSPFLGFQPGSDATEDEALEYLASIAVEIYLHNLNKPDSSSQT